MVAGLMILGVVAAIAIPRFVDLDRNARTRAIEAGIAELNGREKLTWARVKLSTKGWLSDVDLFNQSNYDLGREYDWVVGPDDGSGTTEGGGTLRFQGSFSSILGRVDSTSSTPAHWYRK
jgi:type II secretory pathway pseudopilin PulG